MPRILDNLTPDGDSQMEAALSDTLETSRSLDAAVGYFNLRGWGLVAERVDALPGRRGRPKARVLVGMTEDPRAEMRRLMSTRPPPEVDNAQASERMDDTVAELRAQLEVGLPTADDEAALRKLRRHLDAGEVEVRLYLRDRLHAKLYLAHRDDVPVPLIGYVGSSNLTRAGLREQGELNVDVTDVTATERLAAWFEERWNDPFTVAVNPELVKLLDESWAGRVPLDPFLVYLKMAYHLAREAREGLIRFGLPASMARRLLKFQEAAVKIAARIVTERDGVLIGDVVGLGKTMVATAIARLLQEDLGWETLVVCPKNLVPMWENYMQQYRLHGEVLPLSMVTRRLGRMPRHRLVVVDESHNLRNPKRKDHKALRRYISGNDSKVVLLSATPYNKSLEDLDGQLSLFLDDGADLGIRPERAIAETGEDRFSIDCERRTSSLAAFRLSEHLEDWQTLMSQFMVRRTRRFVEENYADTDRDGRKYLVFGDSSRFYFPRRVARPVEQALSRRDPAARMLADETLDAVKSLHRPRYALSAYLTGAEPADEAERKLIADLKAARGTSAGFNRVFMFKRLSSSGPAFLATLRRHLLRDRVALYAVENGLPYPVGTVDRTVWDDDTGTGDDGILDGADLTVTPTDAYQRLAKNPPRKMRWLRACHLDERFAEHLAGDIASVEGMLDRFGRWDETADGKIDTLAGLILDRHAGEKLLVFTEYADTAGYVHRALLRRGVTDMAVVTGGAGDATELARRFSPGSHPVGMENGEQELRVLISTDVLSEGQNLQDARIVVNYDLPWAIVKLVQRAGRVDRIGQTAHQVLVYTLLPAASVEDEIDLRRRIRDRLEENALLLGSEEQFLGDDREREMVTGLFDEHSDWDLDAGAEDVDPVSMAYEIWRTAERNHPDLTRKVAGMPDVVYATLAAMPDGDRDVRSPGVLVHSQTVTGSDAFALVHRSGKSRRVSPQEALRMARCDPRTPPRRPLPDHHQLVAAAFAGPLTAPPGKVAVVPSGVRGRIYNKLKDHMSNPQLNLLAPEEDLNAALEDLRRYPLQENAMQTLSKADRERTPADLAALVVDLHNNEQLSVYPDTGFAHREPRIICSMGYLQHHTG